MQLYSASAVATVTAPVPAGLVPPLLMLVLIPTQQRILSSSACTARISPRLFLHPLDGASSLPALQGHFFPEAFPQAGGLSGFLCPHVPCPHSREYLRDMFQHFTGSFYGSLLFLIYLFF